MNDSTSPLNMAAPAAEAFAELTRVIERLVGPGGCPWDQKQNPTTLADYLVEEVFELVEAIRSQNHAEFVEELGDVAFLAVFMGLAASSADENVLAEALAASAAKMIRRHPHVFAEAEVSSVEGLWKQWEAIKRAEGKTEKGLFSGLPAALPPLLKAQRIHAKAARIHFTWPDAQGALNQFHAEMRELDQAAAVVADPAKPTDAELEALTEEYGDALFTFVEYGRKLGIKPNAALDAANRKFLRRFGRMEELARQDGREINELATNELEVLWGKVKEAEPKA